jgi:transcriptional regulator with XRE-family HTH domain
LVPFFSDLQQRVTEPRIKRKRIIKVNARKVQESDIALGERIRARRNQIQISQEELGKALGVSFQQIQKYENGTNRISSGRLIQIVNTLQCSVTDLIAATMVRSRVRNSPATLLKEGVAIINAMASIPSAAVRRHVISLAESLSASFTP